MQTNDPNDDSHQSGTIYGGHPIPDVPEINGNDDLVEPQFEEPISSPSVTGEENVFSEEPTGEPADIDTELELAGLKSDKDGIKPLGED